LTDINISYKINTYYFPVPSVETPQTVALLEQPEPTPDYDLDVADLRAEFLPWIEEALGADQPVYSEYNNPDTKVSEKEKEYAAKTMGSKSGGSVRQKTLNTQARLRLK
jgi:hypothetical protein